MIGHALEPEIRELLASRDFATLKGALRELEDADVAELLEEFEPDEQALLFRLLPTGRATEVFSLLPTEVQGGLIERLGAASLANVFNQMSPDDRTGLLEDLPGELAQRMLATLQGEQRKIALDLLNYPEDSVGRIMTPEYVAVRPEWSASRVLEHIRGVVTQKETVNDIYVVDAKWKLLDHITLQDVVLARPDSTMEQLMSGPAEEPALRAADDRETAIELFKKYDMHVLPVVDAQNTLVGIVTSDDILDVVEEEDTEDFQKMAGVVALEDPYFQTGFLRMTGKRLPWLVFLMGAELLTAVAIMANEGALGENIWLIVLFLPLVNASAGNVGSQMAGLVIRGLAVQEMELSDWFDICLRELKMGFVLGVILAALAAICPLLFGKPPEVSLILSTSMLLTLTLANLAGAMIPLGLKWLRLDPAVTSAPLIASIMDVMSAIIFFGTAVTFLRILGGSGG